MSEEGNETFDEKLERARRDLALEIMSKELDPATVQQFQGKEHNLPHMLTTLDVCLRMVERAFIVTEQRLS